MATNSTDFWWQPSYFNHSYYPAAIRDFSFMLPALIPFLFLVHIHRHRRNIYLQYKKTVFLYVYIYATLSFPFFLLHTLIGVRSYFELHTNVLGCSLMKTVPVYYAWLTDPFTVTFNISRYVPILFNIQLPLIAKLAIFIGASCRVWSHVIFLHVYGRLTIGDTCSPLVTTSFLGGYNTVAMSLIGCNIVSCTLNLHLIYFTTKHYRDMKGHQKTRFHHRNERNLVLGLFFQSFIPLITQTMTLLQVNAVMTGVTIPLFLTNISTFVGRSVTFFRMLLPFIFIGTFQDEILYLFRRRYSNSVSMTVQTRSDTKTTV